MGEIHEIQKAMHNLRVHSSYMAYSLLQCLHSTRFLGYLLITILISHLDYEVICEWNKARVLESLLYYKWLCTIILYAILLGICDTCLRHTNYSK